MAASRATPPGDPGRRMTGGQEAGEAGIDADQEPVESVAPGPLGEVALPAAENEDADSHWKMARNTPPIPAHQTTAGRVFPVSCPLRFMAPPVECRLTPNLDANLNPDL